MISVAENRDRIFPAQYSLPEVLVERITEAILSGGLKPGERIVESRLAKELGISRGPLREALKTLEVNGLIEYHKGRGTQVKSFSDEDLVAMIALRANLEGFAARYVVCQNNPRGMAKLSGILKQCKQAAREGRTSDWRDYDWQFHEAVVRLADNQFLFTSWRLISNLVRLFLYPHPGFEREAPVILSNYDKLSAALQSGDPNLAEATFRSIILVSAFRRLNHLPPLALASCKHPVLLHERYNLKRRSGKFAG